MSYTISDAERAQMRHLAASSGLPYAQIVGQKVYDLQGLVVLLAGELAAAQKARDTRKVKEVNGGLTERRAQLAAYQAEQRATPQRG